MNTLIKALLLGGGAYLLYRTGILSSLTGGLIPSSSGSFSNIPTDLPPAFNSLAGTGARVMNAALVDYANGDRSNQLSVAGGVPSTTFNAWTFFLNKQTGFSDLPGYSDVTGQPDPNVPMTFAQYWNLISPWLHNNHGLNGLGEPPFIPADYIGSGMGQLLGLVGAVNSMYATPRNTFWPNPRAWGL